MLSCSTFLPKLRFAASPLKRKTLTASNGIISFPSSSSSSSSYRARLCSAALEPPDVAKLADAARISLSPNEVEEFGPKIRQVIDWFGQLQAVDLESVEPSLRASTEVGSNTREDEPQTFNNRNAIIEAIPSSDGPYIKVPKVVKKE